VFKLCKLVTINPVGEKKQLSNANKQKNLMDKTHKLIVKKLKFNINHNINRRKSQPSSNLIIYNRITHVKNLNNWHLYSTIKKLFCKVFFFAYSHNLVRVHRECDYPHLNHNSLVLPKKKWSPRV
jgi:hypothetical protein